MSADLTWQIIRKNHCFLRRQRGIQKHFSVEPFNLRGTNSRRFNGLINKHGIDMKPAKEGPGVTVTLKIPRKAARPAKSKCVVVLRNREKLLRSVKAIAKSQRLGRFHMLAQRRASAIFRSQLPKSKKHVKKIDS
ncbi:60S ribosomal protein L28 [Parelaphostrongylus tenuis]|uniref:Large ribosomal subunit protein eL28 n=1 Tax=Parelaphostrongylus tenuis TaxID=148309 RepID=A0AAD5RA96_PARTN|nr:60S ribosomal protein L28 [Parelaphostrongylus tenuis]